MKAILPEEQKELIDPQLSLDIERVWADSSGNLDRDATDAEVYFSAGYLKSAVLDKILTAAPRIRWQHTPSAGVNHLLTPLARSRDIILTNSAGVHAIPIAEFVLALILHHAKHLSKLKTLQSEKDWQPDIALTEVYGSTLLIIGAGGIGGAIAQRASAFGMRVWGSRQNPQPTPGFERIVGANEWRSLLPAADYVVVAAPLTPQTQAMFDESAFRALHRSAYFINIARGAIVDETALLTALQEGWIAGAAIDTFTTEPLPQNSPFWSLPNVFATSHCSGSSPHTWQRVIDLFLENLKRYREGAPLLNVVDRGLGY